MAATTIKENEKTIGQVLKQYATGSRTREKTIAALSALGVKNPEKKLGGEDTPDLKE